MAASTPGPIMDDLAALEAPISPLSDVPDDLSVCSEAMVATRLAQTGSRLSDELETHPMVDAPVTPTAKCGQNVPEVLEAADTLETPPSTSDEEQGPCTQTNTPTPQPCYTSVAERLRSHKRSKQSALPIQPLTKRSPAVRAQNTTTSALRRSQRARKAPVKFSPPPSLPTARRASNPEQRSLLVTLSLNPRDLATLSSDASPAQLLTPQTLSKRKTDTLDADSDIKSRSARRRRLENQSSPFEHGPQSLPNLFTQSTQASQPQIEDEQFAQLQSQLGPPSSSQLLEPQPSFFSVTQPELYPAPSVELAQPTLPTHPPWTAPSPPESTGSNTSPSCSQFDAHLYNIAKLLEEARDINPKPEPGGNPEVWADTRMELCETLHYYRSYHGGSYATGGFVRSFLFAGSSHSRDYMDANVVISRAGGGQVKDKETGAMTLGRDQSETSTVLSLRNNIGQFNPVVMITAHNNPYLPSTMPHPYCVMDYFKPTHIWFEKSKGKKFIRYRFEKLNLNKPGWWEPKGFTEVAALGSLESPVVQTCSICSKPSQQVYLQGWMCLEGDCANFWKVQSPTGDFTEPKEASLVYDPRFLKQRTRWPNDDHVYPLASVDVELSGQSMAGEDCLRAHWSGIVCPQCGRCTSRLSWTGWKCATPGCLFEKRPPHTLIPAATVHDAFNPVSAAYTMSRDKHLPDIKMSVSFAHNYRINRFEIPGVEGFIIHMIANKTIIEEAGGPNDMYEDLQRVDIGLARRPMGHDYFTRHYVVNYGMPYKFIAATASAPFTGSARPITSSRSRLNWAAKYILTQETGRTMEAISAEWKEKEFNEVLALGYFENQKISYHDDGETGLGPTIATLSLGDTGTMHIRMKQRYFNGVSKAGVYDTSPPLPGSTQEEKRRELLPSLLALQDSDKNAYNKRLRELPNELKLAKGSTARDAIQMTLQHGDIVMMHGAELQKYYEHSVEHCGKLRFALTCRYIDPESLKEEDKPEYGVAPDDGEYDGAKLPLPGT
ncbi:hypothetical protein CC80DRAFT_489116 [Byssothecium circinans]|uniref:Alpha-ketoglutarate-dependent dioxygenase AlkB-like domain-containing protein n=1 Tax=Byssothecium circinans TaxID=147558 RepID=A0A6A5U7I2_9PLEO|nr:hypothetical protein CC80DRAFT_489116 [Byssothecium circinans]